MTKTGLRVYRWAAKTGKELSCFEDPQTNRADVLLALVVPGAQRILAASRRRWAGELDGAAAVVGDVMRAINTVFGGTPTWSETVLDRTGRATRTFSRDERPRDDPFCLQVWSVHSGLISRTYEAGQKAPVALAGSPDGTQALSSCSDSTVHLWGLPP
jgi:hypothetical protein